jgi:hypothetical protein
LPKGEGGRARALGGAYDEVLDCRLGAKCEKTRDDKSVTVTGGIVQGRPTMLEQAAANGHTLIVARLHASEVAGAANKRAPPTPSEVPHAPAPSTTSPSKLATTMRLRRLTDAPLAGDDDASEVAGELKGSPRPGAVDHAPVEAGDDDASAPSEVADVSLAANAP